MVRVLVRAVTGDRANMLLSHFFMHKTIDIFSEEPFDGKSVIIDSLYSKYVSSICDDLTRCALKEKPEFLSEGAIKDIIQHTEYKSDYDYARTYSNDMHRKGLGDFARCYSNCLQGDFRCNLADENGDALANRCDFKVDGSVDMGYTIECEDPLARMGLAVKQLGRKKSRFVKTTSVSILPPLLDLCGSGRDLVFVPLGNLYDIIKYDKEKSTPVCPSSIVKNQYSSYIILELARYGIIPYKIDWVYLGQKQSPENGFERRGRAVGNVKPSVLNSVVKAIVCCGNDPKEVCNKCKERCFFNVDRNDTILSDDVTVNIKTWCQN